MKNFFISVVFILFLLLSGCNGENKPNEQTQGKNDLGSSKEVVTSDIFNNSETDNTVKEVNGKNRERTINYDYDEYSILGLQLLDSYDKVIQTLGEPKEKSYEVIGTFHVTDQRLYTYMHYENMIVTVQKYFDTDQYISQEGIVEIDIYGSDYKTKRGIKVGDSIDKVKEAYAIKYVFNYGNDPRYAIISDFYNRVNYLEIYKKRDFFFDYGNINKIAYIINPQRSEEKPFPPALIFLFDGDKVSHIILYNSFEKY
jgi:hypothetical protein